jgi:hypothetical protein
VKRREPACLPEKPGKFEKIEAVAERYKQERRRVSVGEEEGVRMIAPLARKL